MNGDPFDSLRAFEKDVLDGLRARERSAKKFKQLIGTTDDTIVTTHRLVIGRLKALENAPDVITARDLLEQLRVEELTKAFKLEGFGDLLQVLGDGLWNRAQSARNEGLFSSRQLQDVEHFASTLSAREAEMTQVHAELLMAIVNQGHGLDDDSLDELRSKSSTMRERLTDDVSGFQAKAKIFKRISVT